MQTTGKMMQRALAVSFVPGRGGARIRTGSLTPSLGSLQHASRSPWYYPVSQTCDNTAHHLSTLRFQKFFDDFQPKQLRSNLNSNDILISYFFNYPWSLGIYFIQLCIPQRKTHSASLTVSGQLILLIQWTCLGRWQSWWVGSEAVARPLE